MGTKAVEILSDAIKEYYGNYELEELCNAYNVEVDYLGVNLNHTKLANKLVEKNDYSHRKLLEKLIQDLVQRCNQRILNTTWESNVFDEQMQPQLKKLQILLSKEHKPVQIAEPKNYHFKDKAELAKFLSKAKTAVTLVDTQLGGNTLECLKNLGHPIRLLTSREPQALVEGFDDLLRSCSSKSPGIEVRRHVMVHDRYIFFNGRCWLANAPLDSIGHRPLDVIECIDAKSAIARTIERKWREAQKHLI